MNHYPQEQTSRISNNKLNKLELILGSVIALASIAVFYYLYRQTCDRVTEAIIDLIK